MRYGHFDDAAKVYVIDTPGESFQTVENNDTGVAESVFIGGMFVLYGGQYADIIERSVAVNGEKIDGNTVPVPTDTTKPINITVTF